MERITINENGNTREVSVVRYIKNNENKYLIYTMGEIEGELQRIYIVKVLEQGELTGIRVPDEEWDEVKRLIQEIVKANRANTKVEIPDLDEKTLNNIHINDKRIIKLKSENIPSLEANKNFVIENAKPIEVEPPVIPEIEVNPVINVEPTVENVVEPPVEPVVEAKLEIPAEPAVPDMTSPIAEPEVSVEPVQSEPAIEFKTVEPTIEHIAETEKEAVVEPNIGETENYKELYEKEQLRVEELTKEVNDLKLKLEKITEILKEQ